MTVSYTSEVTTSRGISCFLKLLARWKGSIYKIVWIDLLLFLALFYAINLLYRFIPDSASKETLESIITYCNKYSSLIPLSFVLGFYVNLVMSRWWSQYTSIPFPDNLAIIIGACIKGQDDRAKIVRRTIMRYVCVTFTITLTMLSPKVKKRFPTHDHFIQAGLLTRDEKKIIEDLDNEFPSYSKYWLPLAWAANIVTRARHEGLIRDDVSIKTILEEMNLFRSRCGGMIDYDWISIPLVYTQVVTIAVYSYFIVAAFGRQYIGEKGDTPLIDSYFPFLTVLEYFFYMGWLKVAEVLINPYGEDDDDFEVVWMIDRHLQVSYLLVDKIHQEHPKLMRDMHWFETAPNFLPHTLASQQYMQEYPVPSTFNVNVKKSDQDIVQPIEEEITEPDGTRRRSGPYLWKIYAQLRKRNNNMSSNGFPLKKVVSHSHPLEVVRESDGDINDYEEGIAVNVPKKTNTSCEEFEKLKKMRNEKHKQKVISLLQFVGKEKREELVNLINNKD